MNIKGMRIFTAVGQLAKSLMVEAAAIEEETEGGVNEAATEVRERGMTTHNNNNNNNNNDNSDNDLSS